MRTLIVLPTARAIREHIARQLPHDGLLAHYIGIGEFFSKVTRHKDKSNIDETQRVLLLREASAAKRFAALRIERNFFTFMRHSEYIFRFFEELSGERIAIEEIATADTYGEYEEHLTLLAQLRKEYKKLVDKAGVIDPVFAKEEYSFCSDYCRRFDSIELFVEGYLTAYEMRLLEEVARSTRLFLHYTSSRFSKKMDAKLLALGFAIEEDHTYLLDFTQKRVVKRHKRVRNDNITCKALDSRILQVAFVKERIESMIQNGIDASKIAVITPDERFSVYLQSFDRFRNLNFAMGFSLAQSKTYRRLHATLEFIRLQNVENRARMERFGHTLFERLKECVEERFSAALFDSIVEPLIAEEEHVRMRNALEELYVEFRYGFVHFEEMRMREAIHLLLERMEQSVVDDVGGGEITVMGLLESRSIAFEGVIIVDFNEGFVPKSSQKDLFLNSAVRKRCGLPTQQDRENLQKHFYRMLIDRAQEAAICYVADNEHLPSPFLHQLNLQRYIDDRALAYAPLLFEHGILRPQKTEHIVAPFNLRSFTLSATMLKSLLTCKRQFYYRYIKRVRAHEIEKDLPKEHAIGVKLHAILQSLYSEHRHFSDVATLKKAFAAHTGAAESVLMRFQMKQYEKILEPFFINEIERFGQGYRVAYTEKELTGELLGVRIYGKIDRIDRRDDTLEVLDYKSGAIVKTSARNLEKTSDFQLQFYELLARRIGDVGRCGYYDLNGGTIVYEDLHNEKMRLLHERIEELLGYEEMEFALTQEQTPCRFCEYKTLCNR